MVIEPRVVQFWSEIILVISNHAYDFSPNCTPLSAITIINRDDSVYHLSNVWWHGKEKGLLLKAYL